jgi:ribosomal protein S18 acetylase RimI-like enzyme
MDSTTPPFFIRSVQEEDALPILTLLNFLIEEGSSTIMDKTISLPEQIDFIRHFPPQGLFFVALLEPSKELLGLQDLTPSPSSSLTSNALFGEISTFVSPAFHRKGVGRALFEATFKGAKEKGFVKIQANVRADNPQALAFYRSLGFYPSNKSSQKQVLRNGKPQIQLLLEKSLE